LRNVLKRVAVLPLNAANNTPTHETTTAPVSIFLLNFTKLFL
jgi:hypothetical protein